VKLLIDECLHLSLVDRAHAAGHAADHVNYLGLGSFKDWELMDIVIERDYTFVLHAGLIVIIPNVTPTQQQELFDAALKHIGQREMVNTVVEVEYDGTQIRCSEYPLP
jgi:predicted nuclease of predicted toxin-antitoxin system